MTDDYSREQNPFTTETQRHRDTEKTNPNEFSVSPCLRGEWFLFHIFLSASRIGASFSVHSSTTGGDMIRLKVNGQERSFDGDPEMPLLWYLRDSLGLTGTKFGCGMALCGACTVHSNGEAIRSCSTSMKEVAGADVTTIEGI